MAVLSIIIPAYNEETNIGACLESLLAQTIKEPLQIIVAANGCKDRTVAVAQDYTSDFAEKGHDLTVLNIPEGRKTNAMNRGDAVATAPMRAYLDADIVCSPDLFNQIYRALDRPDPIYVSGRMEIAPAKNWASRAYAQFWSELPFIIRGVPGAGLYCVNAAGRARWDAFPDKFSNDSRVRSVLTDAQWKVFPDTFSDDGYVRLLFKPTERVRVNASYLFPITEGFSDLKRARRRQDANLANILRHYPDLSQNEDEKQVSAARFIGMVLRKPVGFGVYATIKLLNRMPSPQANYPMTQTLGATRVSPR